MRKKIIILSSVLIAAISGYAIWRTTICSCHEQMAGKSCDGKSCNYDTKMSLVCEFSCAAKNVDASKIVAQSKAKVGDYTKCPVSGVVILVTDESTRISYHGKSAYTCCATCAEIFNKSPEEYVSNIN